MFARVLLVEDEKYLRLTLGDRLHSEGFAVEYASDGDEAYEKAIAHGFDLILLDVMLPRRDGFAVCRSIRQAGLITPILMLTALGQVYDKVKGLKLGADDYVTKPFDMQELLARIEALLRRAPTRPATKAEPYQLGDITIDLRGTEARRNGTRIGLSAREFQLLQYFIEHPGITLSRDDLLKEVWDYRGGTFSRTVDVHVASLRQKIEPDIKQPRFIVTVNRLGYKFIPSDVPAALTPA